MKYFEGDTADQVWQLVARELLSGEAKTQNSRLGMTKELLHVSYQINNPRERWVVSRQPSINPAFAIAEVFWILAGSNNANFINHWNPSLPRFAGEAEQYHGAYGYRIRDQFGYDQLQRAYEVLKNNATSRQVVLQIWDPREDSPDSNGNPVSPDIPCNLISLPKIREGRLEWLQVMRSNDLLRGMPYNIFQFTTLQEILSGWLEIELGAYCHISDSLHVYEADLPKFQISEDNVSKMNVDNLALPKNESDEVVSEIYSILVSLQQPNIAKRKFIESCKGDCLPEPHRNLLVIAAADSARRRGWGEEELEKITSHCTNQQLLSVWNNWLRRFRKDKIFTIRSVEYGILE